MGGLTVQIILQISSAYLFLTPFTSLTLGEITASVYDSEINRTEPYQEFYHEYYFKRVWIVFPWYSYRIKSKSVNRTKIAIEQRCCQGYINVKNICMSDSFNFSHEENCQPPDESSKESEKSFWTSLWDRFFNFRVGNWKGENMTAKQCPPVCSSGCPNGFCIKSNGKCVDTNKCECTEGWEGDFCSVPLFCTISRANETSEFSGSDTLTENGGKNSTGGTSDFPICDSSCFDYVDDSMLSNYSYIPIDSACNTQQWTEYLIRYGFSVPLIIVVIVLLSLIIRISRCLRRKSKPIDSPNNESIPLTTTKTNNYMIENDLYATIKTPA